MFQNKLKWIKSVQLLERYIQIELIYLKFKKMIAKEYYLLFIGIDNNIIIVSIAIILISTTYKDCIAWFLTVFASFGRCFVVFLSIFIAYYYLFLCCCFLIFFLFVVVQFISLVCCSLLLEIGTGLARWLVLHNIYNGNKNFFVN